MITGYDHEIKLRDWTPCPLVSRDMTSPAPAVAPQGERRVPGAAKRTRGAGARSERTLRPSRGSPRGRVDRRQISLTAEPRWQTLIAAGVDPFVERQPDKLTVGQVAPPAPRPAPHCAWRQKPPPQGRKAPVSRLVWPSRAVELRRTSDRRAAAPHCRRSAARRSTCRSERPFPNLDRLAAGSTPFFPRAIWALRLGSCRPAPLLLWTSRVLQSHRASNPAGPTAKRPKQNESGATAVSAPAPSGSANRRNPPVRLARNESATQRPDGSDGAGVVTHSRVCRDGPDGSDSAWACVGLVQTHPVHRVTLGSPSVS